MLTLIAATIRVLFAVPDIAYDIRRIADAFESTTEDGNDDDPERADVPEPAAEMNLEPGKTGYPLPPFSRLASAIISDESGMSYALDWIEPHDLLQAKRRDELQGREPARGVPRYFSVVSLGEVEFWPTPDKAYTARIRYYPPMQEV